MQFLTLADHINDPGMLTGFIVVIVIELFSVGLLILNMYQYQKVVLKHRMLPSAIQHKLEEVPEKGKTALLWVYVFATIVITAGTTLLFILQPHIY
jgi:hypothetical protein